MEAVARAAVEMEVAATAVVVTGDGARGVAAGEGGGGEGGGGEMAVGATEEADSVAGGKNVTT